MTVETRPLPFEGGTLKLCPIDHLPIRKPRRGPTGTYCSAACRRKAYDIRELGGALLSLGNAILETEKAPAFDTRGDHRRLLFEQAETDIRRIVDSCDLTPDEEERLLTALRPWIEGVLDSRIGIGAWPRYANPVLRAMGIGRYEVPTESAS